MMGDYVNRKYHEISEKQLSLKTYCQKIIQHFELVVVLCRTVFLSAKNDNS